MKAKKKIVMVIGVTILTIIGAIGVNNIDIKRNANTVLTSNSTLDNTKIGWGIKRASNHSQPDIGSKNKELIIKYDGIAMGNAEKKYVYLTFDEGYEAGYTPRILQILKENEVKATFFLTAHYINTR